MSEKVFDMVRDNRQPGDRPELPQRRWRGEPIHRLEEALVFFNNAGPVPETLASLERRLNDAAIAHVYMGAIAVNAHGHQRLTNDIDLSMSRADLDRFRADFVGDARPFRAVVGRPRRFLDPQTGVMFDVLVAGEIAGRADRQQEVKFPHPSEAQTVDSLPMVSLARLIELKLVTWRLKDWADVIELIRLHRLDEAFVDQLAAVTRVPFVECIDQMREEDKYNAIHEPHE